MEKSCPNCRGSGELEPGLDCPYCRGTGVKTEVLRDSLEYPSEEEENLELIDTLLEEV